MKRIVLRKLLFQELGYNIANSILVSLLDQFRDVSRKDILPGGKLRQQWLKSIETYRQDFVLDLNIKQTDIDKIMLLLDAAAQKLYSGGYTSDSDFVSMISEDIAELAANTKK